jgi:hypothetical protein
MVMFPADLRDLLTGDQSTQGLELLPQPPDLAVGRTTGGLSAALVEAGEPLGTAALIARTGASAITRCPRQATVPIPALSGRRSSSCRTTPEGRLEPADEPTSAQKLIQRHGTRTAHPPAPRGPRVSIAALIGALCFAGAPQQPRCLRR